MYQRSVARLSGKAEAPCWLNLKAWPLSIRPFELNGCLSLCVHVRLLDRMCLQFAIIPIQAPLSFDLCCAEEAYKCWVWARVTL
jgi:hypothetical protein